MKIKVAVVGYGKVGYTAAQAVQFAPDMELCGIVRSSSSESIAEFPSTPVVKTIEELGKIDVAVLCLPARNLEDYAVSCLQQGINTVDSFGIQSDIFKHKCVLDKAAKQGNARAMTSAGWEPGTDSVIRVLFEVCVPTGTTHTNFDVEHGSSIERSGSTGLSSNQNLHFSMHIHNPAITSQVMVSSARAVLKQAPGAYTLMEIPVIDLLPGEREDIINRLAGISK